MNIVKSVRKNPKSVRLETGKSYAMKFKPEISLGPTEWRIVSIEIDEIGDVMACLQSLGDVPFMEWVNLAYVTSITPLEEKR